ncbi:15776_t:CDS:2, partial [Cetraspora pellucida]
LLGTYLTSSTSTQSALSLWFKNLLINFLVAIHSSVDENTLLFRHSDIVVLYQNFSAAIHNKNANYCHLIARFIANNDINRILITLNDLYLELLLFPDLYPDGCEHYQDIQFTTDETHYSPTAIEIIKCYIYTNSWHYNETKTSPIPTFIYTDDGYFQKKKYASKYNDSQTWPFNNIHYINNG